MAEPALHDFLALVHGRRGHFRMESGYHADLWLDLDALFGRPRLIAPFVARLGDRLRHYEVDFVCGPLLGGALLAQSLATALGAEFCFTQPVPPDSGDRPLYGSLPAAGRLPTTSAGPPGRPR